MVMGPYMPTCLKSRIVLWIFLRLNHIREFKGLVRTHMSTCYFFKDFKILQGCTNEKI
jgi:hypothetical protein